MKRFRVLLTLGGPTFVHATRYESAEGWVRFYREESLVAEYVASMVHRVEPVRTLADPPSTRGGRRR